MTAFYHRQCFFVQIWLLFFLRLIDLVLCFCKWICTWSHNGLFISLVYCWFIGVVCGQHTTQILNCLLSLLLNSRTGVGGVGIRVHIYVQLSGQCLVVHPFPRWPKLSKESRLSKLPKQAENMTNNKVQHEEKLINIKDVLASPIVTLLWTLSIYISLSRRNKLPFSCFFMFSCFHVEKASIWRVCQNRKRNAMVLLFLPCLIRIRYCLR